jgi:D-alanine-D-alanine ligase
VRKLRVLLLCHEDLVPPDSREGYDPDRIYDWQAEYAVAQAIRALGHDLQVLGVSDDVLPIGHCVAGFEPHVVFNQLVELRDVGAFAVHVVSYLELLGVPYTGCNPQGLTLARDKGLCKKILRYHRIPTPAFLVFPAGRKPRIPRRLGYPLIVKSLDEEASRGVSQASIVWDAGELAERVGFVHRHVGTAAIAEQYVQGRELTVSILGNERLTTLPVWELRFGHLPEGTEPIATERVKWDRDYQKRLGVENVPAELPGELAARIARVARRSYRALALSGYARLDLRLSEDGRIHVIEANPNPDLMDDEDLALAAARAGISYARLIQRIIALGIAYRAPGRLSR